MKHPILMRVAPVLLAGIVSACGGGSAGGSSSPATPSGPSPVTTGGSTSTSCTASVTGMPGSIPGAAGRYTLTLTTGAGCAWTAASDANWATVDPTSGQGSGTPVVTVEANPEVTNSRSANLTIAGQVVHFSQANACTYSIDQTTADVDAGGSRVGITLTTKDGCPWTASGTDPSWVHVHPTSGSGSDIINIDLDANTGDVRHATVTIAGLRVLITQRGR